MRIKPSLWALLEAQRDVYPKRISFGLVMLSRTSLFLSNRSQAVRLPKAVAFPVVVKEVIVLQDGPRRIIVPAGAAWDDFFDGPGVNLGARSQPEIQQREVF